MRQEIALDGDGAPVVMAFRSDEGQLTFRYLVVRPGGMSVWLPVGDDIQRQVSMATGRGEPAALAAQIQAAAIEVANQLLQDDTLRLARVEELEALVEAQGEELEALRAKLVDAPPPTPPEVDPAAIARSERASRAGRAAQEKRRARATAA